MESESQKTTKKEVGFRVDQSTDNKSLAKAVEVLGEDLETAKDNRAEERFIWIIVPVYPLDACGRGVLRFFLTNRQRRNGRNLKSWRKSRMQV